MRVTLQEYSGKIYLESEELLNRHYFALTDLGINNNNRASVLLSLKKWKRKRKKKRINICEDTFNDYTQCHTETDNIAFGARHR